MSWQAVSRCKCGRSLPSSWFVHSVLVEENVCSGCGESMRDNYSHVVERWVSDAVLFKPWTWFRGHYERKERP